MKKKPSNLFEMVTVLCDVACEGLRVDDSWLIVLPYVPQVQLFSEPGFQGSVLALEDSVASVQEGFSVASCKVLAGRYCSRWTKTKYQAVVIVI